MAKPVTIKPTQHPGIPIRRLPNKRRHPVYLAWIQMRQRCNNPSCPAYRYYGARGITICPNWELFESFWEDMIATWSEGLSIDRMDNDGPYSRDNCRWATRSQQQRNKRWTALRALTIENVRDIRRRHAEGERQSSLHRRYGVARSTIHNIVHRKTWAHV